MKIHFLKYIEIINTFAIITNLKIINKLDLLQSNLNNDLELMN